MVHDLSTQVGRTGYAIAISKPNPYIVNDTRNKPFPLAFGRREQSKCNGNK